MDEEEFDEQYQGYEEWLDEQSKLNPWEDEHVASITEDTKDT